MLLADVKNSERRKLTVIHIRFQSLKYPVTCRKANYHAAHSLCFFSLQNIYSTNLFFPKLRFPSILRGNFHHSLLWIWTSFRFWKIDKAQRRDIVYGFLIACVIQRPKNVWETVKCSRLTKNHLWFSVFAEE